MYRLKKSQPPFAPTMGKFAGRLFTHGELYAEIPPEEKGRFESAKSAAQKIEKEADK